MIAKKMPNLIKTHRKKTYSKGVPFQELWNWFKQISDIEQ